MMTDVVAVYITVPDEQQAASLARTLVEERLAACVNAVPGIRSFYRWEGQVKDEQEWLLLVKTRGELFPRLRDRVASLHSYSVPCITALPVVEGHPAYLDWVREETG